MYNWTCEIQPHVVQGLMVFLYLLWMHLIYFYSSMLMHRHLSPYRIHCKTNRLLKTQLTWAMFIFYCSWKNVKTCEGSAGEEKREMDHEKPDLSYNSYLHLPNNLITPAREKASCRTFLLTCLRRNRKDHTKAAPPDMCISDTIMLTLTLNFQSQVNCFLSMNQQFMFPSNNKSP